MRIIFHPEMRMIDAARLARALGYKLVCKDYAIQLAPAKRRSGFPSDSGQSLAWPTLKTVPMWKS